MFWNQASSKKRVPRLNPHFLQADFSLLIQVPVCARLHAQNHDLDSQKHAYNLRVAYYCFVAGRTGKAVRRQAVSGLTSPALGTGGMGRCIARTTHIRPEFTEMGCGSSSRDPDVWIEKGRLVHHRAVLAIRSCPSLSPHSSAGRSRTPLLVLGRRES